MREGWLRAATLLAVTVVALFLGYWLSGAGLGLLKPRNWDDLLSGLGTGLQALGTVRLPYVSADPWPGIVLELLGAQLLILAGPADVLAAHAVGHRVAPAADAAGPRLSDRLAGGAAGRHRLAGRLARRDRLAAAAARPRARRADRLLPVARAAPVPPRPGVAGLLALALDRRAADRRAGRSRRAVVRLSLLRGEPRARRPDPLLVGAELRADLVAARRQRGHARRVRRAAVLEGAQPGRVQRPVLDDAHGRRSTASAASRSTPTCPPTGRTTGRSPRRSTSACGACASAT